MPDSGGLERLAQIINNIYDAVFSNVKGQLQNTELITAFQTKEIITLVEVTGGGIDHATVPMRFYSPFTIGGGRKTNSSGFFDQQATQGWLATQLKALSFDSATATVHTIFDLRNDANNYITIDYDGAGNWRIRRTAGGTVDQLLVADTFTFGDDRFICAYWDATHIALSINGGAFTTAASTHIPTLTNYCAVFDYGSQAGSLPL